MKIISEITLENFQAWSGAIDTQKTIINNNKGDAFNTHIEELFPDGLTNTELNDYLWFEPESIFKDLGIEEEESN